MIKQGRIYSASGFDVRGLVFPDVLGAFDNVGIEPVFDPGDLETGDLIWVLRDEEWKITVLLKASASKLLVMTAATRQLDIERVWDALRQVERLELESEREPLY